MIRQAEEQVPLWVLGARGMLAGELLRLLELHPALRLAGAVSRSPAELAGPLLPEHYVVSVTLSGNVAEEIAAALGAMDLEAPQY